MRRMFRVRIAAAVFVFASVPAWSQSGDGKQRASLGVIAASAAYCEETRGACITTVRPGSAGERAGLLKGDLITRVGNVDVEDPERLGDAMRVASAGERIELKVRREGKEITLPVAFTQADVASAAARRTSPWPPVASPPYEELAVPSDPGGVSARLAGRDTTAWIEEDVLSIVHRDSRDSVRMLGTFQSPMSRIPGSDLWMMRLKMRGWENAFFTLGFLSPSAGIRGQAGGTFFGPKAPRELAKASPLKGSIIQKTLESRHLGSARAITVYLPPGASERGSSLPVLFMVDGQSCEGFAMEATSKGWSEGRNVIGHVLKFGVLVQRVRIPPGQSVDPQAGNEPCSKTGNRIVDA